MARKRRDEEVVISALKRIIADKSCPVGGRIYCIVVLGGADEDVRCEVPRADARGAAY